MEEKAMELSNAILESEEYKQYLTAKCALDQKQELLLRVNEYRKKNFYIQNSEGGNKQEEIRRLTGEYYDVLNEKIVSDFLQAELLLCRCIQKINAIMMERLDFDVSFIK